MLSPTVPEHQQCPGKSPSHIQVGPAAVLLTLGCLQPPKAFLWLSHPSLDLAESHKNSKLLLPSHDGRKPEATVWLPAFAFHLGPFPYCRPTCSGYP